MELLKKAHANDVSGGDVEETIAWYTDAVGQILNEYRATGRKDEQLEKRLHKVMDRIEYLKGGLKEARKELKRSTTCVDYDVGQKSALMSGAKFVGAKEARLVRCIMLAMQHFTEDACVRIFDGESRQTCDVVTHHPRPFAAIRALRDLSTSFAASFCEGMYEMVSPGKSGQFLYYTNDLRFVVKTISREELDMLRETDFCDAYCAHLRANPDSLLNKIFGVFSLVLNEDAAPTDVIDAIQKGAMRVSRVLEKTFEKMFNGEELAATTTHFIVMENVFPPEPEKIYDLKGSTVNRTNPGGTIQKDLDFNHALNLPPALIGSVVRQLALDTAFLETRNVMDYSMLLGIYPDGGIKMAIIDFLQPFNLRKKGESIVKGLAYSSEASVIHPKKYAARFRDFLTKVFVN